MIVCFTQRGYNTIDSALYGAAFLFIIFFVTCRLCVVLVWEDNNHNAYDYRDYMDYMDLDVSCPGKAVKLNPYLTHLSL